MRVTLIDLVYDTNCAIGTIRALHDSIAYCGKMSPASRRKAMDILFHALMHLECRPIFQRGSSVPETGVRRYLRLNERWCA